MMSDPTANRLFVIGLAAAPAGGKSTVAHMLADLGAIWINADKLAHNVLEQPEARQQLLDQWGESILNRDGSLDRSRIAELVFGRDPACEARLRFLESVIHPQVRLAIERQLTEASQAGARVAVLDVPLLFESGWAERCNEVWFIDTPLALRQQVARERGWTAEQLEIRESKQLEIREKQARSSRTLRNEGTLQELRNAVHNIWLDCGFDRR